MSAGVCAMVDGPAPLLASLVGFKPEEVAEACDMSICV